MSRSLREGKSHVRLCLFSYLDVCIRNGMYQKRNLKSPIFINIRANGKTYYKSYKTKSNKLALFVVNICS